MTNNNESMQEKIFLGIGYLNQMHLTSADYVADVINFGPFSDMIEIVLLHAVPLNF